MAQVAKRMLVSSGANSHLNNSNTKSLEIANFQKCTISHTFGYINNNWKEVLLFPRAMAKCDHYPYADDFLLGFVGPKDEAHAIKQKIGQFLKKLHLQLSEEKTYIPHARTQAAKFLGYLIQTGWNNTRMTKRPDNVKIRSANGQIQLQIPKAVQTKWIRRYSKRGKPIHLGPYLHLSDYEIVKNFGSQLRGLINYYSLANNIAKALYPVRWMCMESARKSLASKHKVQRIAFRSSNNLTFATSFLHS